MKKQHPLLRSVIVLTLICLIITAILAVVNHYTAPVIEENELKSAQDACAEVMPKNQGFTELTDLSCLDSTSSVNMVYRENSGDGYVFRMTVTGYQTGLTVMCGIGNDGAITGVKTLVCNETAGYGQKCTATDFTKQFVGQNASFTDIDGLSGATKTKNAYDRAIKDAFTAFECFTAQTTGGAD